MAKKHTIKLCARLVQKGIYKEADVPEDIRKEVMELSKTLPLREDMKVNVSESMEDNKVDNAE